MDRRFLFNASNYRDSTAETNNNNGAVSGQDDIDDDNDAWQNVSGITIMTPGVGYAATHNSIGFFGSGTSFSYSFKKLCSSKCRIIFSLASGIMFILNNLSSTSLWQRS